MRCCTYFAVVNSTKRLTRLFSRVLKYCAEERGFKTGKLRERSTTERTSPQTYIIQTNECQVKCLNVRLKLNVPGQQCLERRGRNLEEAKGK